MKLKKSLIESEVEEFIRLNKGKKFNVESVNGKITFLETDDISIITEFQSKGFVGV